jgi:hypothetical protein
MRLKTVCESIATAYTANGNDSAGPRGSETVRSEYESFLLAAIQKAKELL